MVKRITALAFIMFPAATMAEIELSIGWQSHQAQLETRVPEIDASDPDDSGYRVGFAVRRSLGESKNHKFGFGVNIDEVLGDTLVGLRALDYQYQFTNQFRAGLFFGAASLDSGSFQDGYYFGGSARATDVFSDGVDIFLELSRGSGLARDRLLETDPQPPAGERSPDIFLDFNAAVVGISYRF